MRRGYADYPQLSGIYLEDSYVLGISETPTEIVFDLEVVLTQDNPAYHEPIRGEQYCYARGRLTFHGITGVTWLARSFQKYTAADGDEDLGNIDSLTCAGGIFDVVGDWGQVRIRSDDDPTFELSTDSAESSSAEPVA